MAEIAATGYWLDETEEHHVFDEALAAELASLFRSKSVVDLGCGPGHYVASLRRAEVDCDGYDGNPNTSALSGGLCNVLDLSASIELGRQYDWVLSLEVGEHIPQQYEAVFLENIVRHAREGVILSWGLPGQSGWGHVNLRDNRYIKDYFRSRGFVNDSTLESRLRDKSMLLWFKGTLMAFRRGQVGKSTANASAEIDPLLSSIPDNEYANQVWREELSDSLKQLQRSVGDTYWLILMQRIREIVQATVPPGSLILVVGECDDELMQLPDRRTAPFPQSPEGISDGWKPVRGTDAIAHLKALRDKGADFVLFPATSHWWLEHYRDLRTYLETECRSVFQAQSTCTIYALGDK